MLMTSHIRSRPIAAGLLTILAVVLLPATATAGKQPKKRVAVTAFENKADASNVPGGWSRLGRGLSEKLVDALLETNKFVVLERLDLTDVQQEIQLGASAPAVPGQAARLTSAQALIRGTITDFEMVEADKGKLGLGRFKLGGGTDKVIIKLNIRLMDTVTGQVLHSKSVVGDSRRWGLRIRDTKNGNETDSQRRAPLSDAVEEAIAEAIQGILAGMEQIPWQGSIARVSGKEIVINAGAQENVDSGMRLKVFQRGRELIDAETNESLGRLDEEIGVVEIVRVNERFSIAQPIEGRGFAVGNIVKPLFEPL